jgi:hypothetical protein
MNGPIETRPAYELRAPSTGRLEGYAAVFNAMSRDLGGFTESIQPGAFTRSLADADNVMALYEHEQKSVLGRVGSGTLRLREDQRGLFFEVDLPPTQVARDLTALIERRDITGASFAFSVPKGGDYWSEVNGKAHRNLIDVTLHEITVTSNPAYVDTSVARRHLQHVYVPVRLRNAHRFMETLS